MERLHYAADAKEVVNFDPGCNDHSQDGVVVRLCKRKGLLMVELRPLSRNLQIILANFRNPLQIFTLGCNTYLDLFTRIKTHSCRFI